jgi:short-subunit dehydrogenase
MKNYVCITGATGGLGKAFALECASRGWNLYLTDLTPHKLSTFAAGLERLYGIEVQTYACDLTDPDQRQAFWEQARQRKVCLDFLINVAGMDFEGPFAERDHLELRTILRLNIEATVEMTRSSLGFNNPEGTFHIVNVCSLAGFYPMPVKAVYAASKRFLLDFSLALRQEMRGRDVEVLALCPAGMPTTLDCIEKISSQGFMGKITTLNVGDVAARTVDLALAGRPIYIPGLINQFLRFLGGLFPPTLVAALIGWRWKQTSRKVLSIRSARQSA